LFIDIVGQMMVVQGHSIQFCGRKVHYITWYRINNS